MSQLNIPKPARSKKPLLFGLFGALIGAAVAILIRPSYPDVKTFDLKPTLLTMIDRGITGKDPTDRKALLLLIGGLLVGAFVGWLIGYLLSRKRRHLL